jgi:hypothetical protein
MYPRNVVCFMFVIVNPFIKVIKRIIIIIMNKTYFTGEITLHVAQIVNREQLQHYLP